MARATATQRRTPWNALRSLLPSPVVRRARLTLPVHTLHWLVAAGYLLAAPAAPLELAPLAVEAPPLPAADRTAAATVLTPQGERARGRDLPELLEESAGVSVKRFGPIGSFATVSVRGTSANQVTLFLDGVPLAATESGTVDLSTLPLSALSRVEVYRGTSPVALGGQGIGGVVNLITVDATRPRTTASATGASFATQTTALTHARPIGHLHLLAHLDLLHTAGDFPFADDHGTPLNPADDQRPRRENNRQEQASLLLKADGPAPAGRWRATSLTFARATGVAGLAPRTASEAHLSQGREVATLGWEGERGRLAGVTARLFGEVERLRFTDRLGEVGVGRQANEETTTSVGVTVTAVREVGRHGLTLLGQGLDERYRAINRLADPAAATPQQRRVATVATEDQIALADGRLTVAPAVRYARYLYDFAGTVNFAGLARPLPDRPDAGHLTPKVGLHWAATEELALRANGGRYVREPSFSELFGNRGALLGNPELAAERGTTWDAGGDWEGDVGAVAVALGYTYFHLRLTDLIQLVQTSQRVARPENASGAALRGHEVEGSVHLGRVGLHATWTHQTTEDRSGDAFADGHPLPGRPRDEVAARLTWAGEQFAPFYTLHHQGERSLDRANRVRVAARTLHDVGVRWRPRGGASPDLTFEIDNLTDDATADVAGFPLPGRTVRAGVAWSF